jgi:asparagine synthase (glutamine-hydrolysing)
MYFHNAPSKGDFHMECLRRIHDLSYFDVLRCDKCTAGAGLEVRVPFLNENFRDMYLCLPANWRMPSHWGIEKYLLRKAFSGTNTIPETVIWRPKEGMSDGVSSQSRSWYQIIQDYAQSQIREPNETDYIPQSSYNSPKTIDGKWFRQIFNEYYGNELRENERCVFRYYWLPKWSGDVVDPSARVLSVYKQ